MQGVIDQKKSDKIRFTAFNLLFVLLWTENTIVGFLERVIEALPIIGVIAEEIVLAIYILLIVFSLPMFIKNTRPIDVMLYLTACFALFVTMAFYSETAEFIKSDLWRILGLTIPMYFVGLSFEYEDLKKLLYVVSVAGVFAMMAYQLYLAMSGREVIEDNMYAAYNVLPSAMYLVHYAFKNGKMSNWIFAIFAIFALFVYGTRGPILALFVFLVVEIFFIKSGTRKTKAVFITIIIIAAILLISDKLSAMLINMIKPIFDRLGFSTRIFDLFLKGNIATDNGRDVLLDSILSAIKEKPILGYGIMGDRPIIGTYSHNLFVELWCHFGVIIGSVFALILIRLVVRAFKIDDTGFMMMMICTVFVKLMLSSSYLYESNLYLLLGIAVSLIRERKKCTNAADVKTIRRTH